MFSATINMVVSPQERSAATPGIAPDAKLCKSVLNYVFAAGSLTKLDGMLALRRASHGDHVVFCVDDYFKDKQLLKKLPIQKSDEILFIDTTHEPKTTGIDALVQSLLQRRKGVTAAAVVGIGGGTTLDTAKAISNLLTNGGKAADYQGWDLVKRPGIFKIGVPTLSGTGAESSRTCVMTNPLNGLKLGMNSEHTIFDQLVLDPELTRTASRIQYFVTGMDTYVHCVESLAGRYRHALGDAFSRQALNLCREVFLGDDMMSDENREKLMVASYLGGCALANSFVGVVHPFSAGLSVVYGIHHGLANCVTMMAMDQFYPAECAEFRLMVDKQGVTLPEGPCRKSTPDDRRRLYESTVIHQKPLSNALGDNFIKILTPEKVDEIFSRM